MKIVVCVRQGLDGNISPFDACAYEAALGITDAEITLLSMGPESTKDFLLSLTRLGAKKAILLSDKAFAGADTIATAYTLSLAIKKIKPDLVLCGRQTLIGDTAQTGGMLSVYSNTSLISNVMSIDKIEAESISCTTRETGEQKANFPALITVERINTLRLPSIFSKLGTLEVWDAEFLGANINRCGIVGSPTRVINTYENESGKRKCTFLKPEQFLQIVKEAIKKSNENLVSDNHTTEVLKNVYVVGDEPMDYAKSISDDITIIPKTNAQDIKEIILKNKPSVVLWASDSWSKETAAKVSALLDLGLCADCTALEVDGGELVMYRPALSGSIIAKIKSKTLPAMATVRTAKKSGDILIAAGYGVKNNLEEIYELANELDAELVTTRKMVDNGILPYNLQVGLTGKKVAPRVYIALGVSGAVHHIVGMDNSSVVIAVNPDKNAPIFDYADYGILAEFKKFI